MTILGTGIDIVENARMAALLEKWGPRFRNRVFLAAEQAYCDSRAIPALHYAARFAVKEAVSKAFGTGIGPGLNWLDIEVLRDLGSGRPSVRLSTEVLRRYPQHATLDVMVSLAHSDHYAVANVILVAP